jgi:glycosyltransferase involved in cell wall biosynthesis
MIVLFVLDPLTIIKSDASGIGNYANSLKLILESRGVKVIYYWDDGLNMAEIDIVHLFGSFDSMYRVASKFRTKKIVFSPIYDPIHPRFAEMLLNKLSTRYFLSRRWQRKKLCQIADGLALMSEFEFGKIKDLSHGLVNKNWHKFLVNTDVITPNISHRRGSFYLFIGDISNPRQNVKKLLKVFEKSENELILIGPVVNNGKYVQKLLALIERNKNITYLGFVSKEEKIELLSDCRSLIIPALTAGFGMVAIEAIILGTNVVFTQNGGTNEYFEDYVSFNPRSLRDLKRAISDNRKAIPKQFEKMRLGEGYINFYDKL